MKIVSDQLQCKTLEMSHVNDLIRTVIDSIQEMRSEETCNELLNEAKNICEQHNIPLKPASGKRREKYLHVLLSLLSQKQVVFFNNPRLIMKAL